MFHTLFLALATSLPLLVGSVKDLSNQPVKVRISIKGTRMSTMSDERGNFHFMNVPSDGILIFRYGGKKTEVEIEGRDKVKIKLLDNLVDYFFPMPDWEQLTAAVVTAEAKKVVDTGATGKVDADNYAGNASSVSGKDLSRMGYTTLAEALAGKSAGVFITDEGQVLMRGFNTFNAENPYALLICDNFEIESLYDVMLEDVDQVYFLKDGDMYGSRGSNGVVIITTKVGI